MRTFLHFHLFLFPKLLPWQLLCQEELPAAAAEDAATAAQAEASIRLIARFSGDVISRLRRRKRKTWRSYFTTRIVRRLLSSAPVIWQPFSCANLKYERTSSVIFSPGARTGIPGG